MLTGNSFRYAITALALLLCGSSVSQDVVINSYRFGAGGGGPTPPYTVDFTSGFSPGVLEGQNGWDDKGDGDNYTVTTSSGVYNSEGGWSSAALQSAQYSTGTLNNDMQAYCIWGSQGEDGSGMGAAIRMDAAGTSYYSVHYTDDDEAVRLYKTVSGTSSQLEWWDQSGSPLSSGDSIRVAVKSDTLYVWYKGTLQATAETNDGTYDASVTTGSYAGMTCYGGTNQYIIEWGATNWP